MVLFIVSFDIAKYVVEFFIRVLDTVNLLRQVVVEVLVRAALTGLVDLASFTAHFHDVVYPFLYHCTFKRFHAKHELEQIFKLSLRILEHIFKAKEVDRL